MMIKQPKMYFVHVQLYEAGGCINVNQYSRKASQANMPVCACFLTV